MAWTGTPQAAGSAPQAAVESSQDPDTTIPHKLHPSSNMASTSTPHGGTTAQQAYEKFLDDAIGTLPEIDPFGDLDNEVHPLFRRENFWKQIAEDPKPDWERVSHAAYTAMLPTPRLASLLITQQSMCHVFDHIANSDIAEDENGIAYMAKGLWEGSQVGYDYVQAVFRFMVSRTGLSFPLNFSHQEARFKSNTVIASTARLSLRHERLDDYITWAGLNGLRVVRLKDEHGQTIDRHILECRNSISFRSSFLEYFEKDVQHDTSRGKMNALFSMLSTLMHEVTHAFGHHVENYFLCQSIEHRWSLENPIQELGWAYEVWFFQDVPPRYANACIFFVSNAKPDEITRSQSPSGSDYILRAEDMRKWLLKSRWQDIESGKTTHADIMRSTKCTEVRASSPHMLVLVKGEEVARFDLLALREKGWFERRAQGSQLGEGFYNKTTSQEFNLSMK